MTDDNNGSGASGTTGTAGVPDVVLNSTYDAMGDRLSLAAAIASTADFKNTYTFDAMGDETNIIQQSNGGNTVAYKQVFLSYDQDHRLGQLSDNGGPSYEDFALWEYMQYNHDGNLTSFQDYGYDYTGSTGPSSYGGYGYSGDIEMESLSMSYDNDQRLTEVYSPFSGTQTNWYGYDHDSQLSYWDSYGVGNKGDYPEWHEVKRNLFGATCITCC